MDNNHVASVSGLAPANSPRSTTFAAGQAGGLTVPKGPPPYLKLFLQAM
jgi:hypothetical protein